VLTNNPHIVIARPPRRIRKAKPGPKITRVIVGREPARRFPRRNTRLEAEFGHGLGERRKRR
jgi:hypothetical protein